MVVNLVVNTINYNKNRTYTAKVKSNELVEVTFRLSIPAWMDDSELIKEDYHKVLYAKTKKTNAFLVTIKNVNDGYPSVGNNKYFLYSRDYNILDWVKSGIDITQFLLTEREKVFRELRSNIILEQIGDLTKKWTDVSDGKFHNSLKPSYAAGKYTADAQQAYGGLIQLVYNPTYHTTQIVTSTNDF